MNEQTFTLEIINLSFQVNEDDLKGCFEKCGNLSEIKLFKTTDGLSKGKAKLVLSKAESARKALDICKDLTLKGRKVKATLYSIPKPTPQIQKSLSTSNMSTQNPPHQQTQDDPPSARQSPLPPPSRMNRDRSRSPIPSRAMLPDDDRESPRRRDYRRDIDERDYREIGRDYRERERERDYRRDVDDRDRRRDRR